MGMMIYCVEDDRNIRELMVYTLKVAGFEAKGFEDGCSFREGLDTDNAELILLDIMLPGEDGVSILRQLKENADTAGIPVIMASAKGSEFDKVNGLDLGADDYLVKPFGMMEMISRIRAVLRRYVKKSGVLVYKDIMMEDEKHRVSVQGEEIDLTPKEYELLKLFLTNAGIVFTRDRLLSLIWGYEYAGETRTVDVHIGTLRTKLKESGSSIQTVRGVGYRLESYE